jgi:hypothetical protein
LLNVQAWFLAKKYVMGLKPEVEKYTLFTVEEWTRVYNSGGGSRVNACQLHG